MGLWETLPKYRGLPVPYVARWSDEVMQIPYVIDEEPVHPEPEWPLIHMKDAAFDVRDDDGVLWQPEASTPTGVAEFGMVSTRRHVECMRYKVCQVCGAKIETNLLFLLPMIEGAEAARVDEPFITTTPPTCRECVKVAVKMCPHLKSSGAVLIRVEESAEWGVFGEWARLGMTEQGVGLVRGQSPVPFGAPAIRSTLAKQLMLEIRKFSEERRWTVS